MKYRRSDANLHRTTSTFDYLSLGSKTSALQPWPRDFPCILIVKISYKTADGAISGDLTITKDVIMFNPDLTGENNLKITSGNF